MQARYMNLVNKLLQFLIPAIIAGLILFGFLYGCQAPYENDQLDANAKIPVVNGVLANKNGKSYFELYYARPYNQSNTQKIVDAQVTLSDQTGHVITLVQPGPGNYQLPESDQAGLIGNTYTLTVQTIEGEVFKSEPMFIPDSMELFNVYIQDNKIREKVIQSSNGEFVTVSESGIEVNFVLGSDFQANSYWRAQANYYVHSRKQEVTESGYSYIDSGYQYNYKIYYDTSYDVYEGFQNIDPVMTGQLLTGQNYSTEDLTVSPLFLVADPECRNFSAYTSNTFVEWIIPATLYSTTKTVYQYYADVREQLSAPSRIYDPIPQQVVGNMSSNNPANVVLGLFDASSISSKYYRIYVLNNLGYLSYQCRYLGDDYTIKGGTYPYSWKVDTVFVDSVKIELP